MTGIILTLSVAGLLAGFIFSMPIAGPISVLIVSNALKGNLRYCYLLTIGASLSDLVYVFIAVFGLTSFYSAYKPVIPYLMLLGAVFVAYTGYRIFKSRIDPDHIDDKVHPKGSDGGFHTGLMINFLNPTLFFGWLTSSFIVISIVSSLGFSTGGLKSTIDSSMEKIEGMGETVMKKPELPAYLKFDTLRILKTVNSKVVDEDFKRTGNHHFIVSLCFAAALSLGSILWFLILTAAIYKYKKAISLKFLNLTINGLGIFLCFGGMYILYKAIAMIIS
jgi:threonine/homoserine/homoserine lactone efflux protein